MSKKTLNAANLSTLGADRLAALLIEVSRGSAEIKRRLRLELADSLGPHELASDVRKRLVSLRRSTSRVSWRKRPAFVRDLATQADMITARIAPEDAALGFDLVWDFLDLAPSVYRRVDDGRGEVGEVFRTVRAQMGDIALRANPDPRALAERVWDAVQGDGYGAFDGLIALLAPTLGATGLTHLRALVETHVRAPLPEPEETHTGLRFLRDLQGAGDNYRAAQKARLVRTTLQQIAEAQGDTDAYIAQYSDRDLSHPRIAADAARRLLAEGRAQEALDLLGPADGQGDADWDLAHVDALIALGRTETAQAHRWRVFSDTLDDRVLRAYLKMLPDFEDIEAEDRARVHALTHPDVHTALVFLLNWPDPVSAARLVQTRTAELNGDLYAVLTPAAGALRDRHPLAAVLCLRAMIDFALTHGRTGRYGHAADHLMDCAALDGDIPDYGPIPTHLRYVEALRARHERKAAFWRRLA